MLLMNQIQILKEQGEQKCHTNLNLNFKRYLKGKTIIKTAHMTPLWNIKEN